MSDAASTSSPADGAEETGRSVPVAHPEDASDRSPGAEASTSCEHSPGEGPDGAPIYKERAVLARRAVRLYQEFLSPLKMGPSCRFEPTCSNYALTALERHGLFKGLLLSIGRLLRCAPWHPGGWDPVPPRKRRPKRKS